MLAQAGRPAEILSLEFEGIYSADFFLCCLWGLPNFLMPARVGILFSET
jgi:hypothetical protein